MVNVMTHHDAAKELVSDETSDFEVEGPSKIARRLDDLKRATFKAIGARERLPQPLFWSLFSSEIEVLREERRVQRQLRKILYDIDL